jgi:putative ABC transport system permease protein
MHLDSWRGELRFAWRNVVRRPGFSALVVVTLALGIGVNSAVFALVDRVLLQPLPYRDPSKLVFIWQTLPEHNVFELEATPFDYSIWKGARSFATIALIATGSFTLNGDGEAERVRGARMTASLMPLLGVSPLIGRGFTGSEDDSDAAPVVALGDGLWRRRFGADPRIVGRVIRIDGEAHTVIGVMPPGAVLPGSLGDSSELWLPARMTPVERTNRISHNYVVIGRLAAGVTLQQAVDEMKETAARVAVAEPTHQRIGVNVASVTEQTVRSIRPTLIVLIGGVALLLLITSANVSTLLITRASSRMHEIAVRTALGATRGRLRSLAIAESVMLAALGGLAGLVLGHWVLRGLLPIFEQSLPRAAAVPVDARVALLTMGASLAMGVALGFVVAAQKPAAGMALGLESSSRAIGSVRTTRVRSLLLTVQIALAVVLLSAAGLMLRSYAQLSAVRPGFTADRLLTFRLALPDGAYQSLEKRAAFAGALLEKLRSAAGISAAAINSGIPFGGSRGANGLEIEGRPARTGELLIADQRHVTPGYFQAMNIPILVGRDFTARDDQRSEAVALVNREMARTFWGSADPVNARVKVSAGPDSSAWIRIVGVVGDVRHVALNRPPVAEMYRPYAQMPVANFTVVAKTGGEPAAAGRLIRTAVEAIDRELPIYDMRTMEQRIAGSFAGIRATMLLLLATAILATLLAGIAIYGSIWYTVSLRIPEIGVRLALGATPASVCLQVVGRSVVLTLGGAVLGTAAALAGSPLLRTLLFETHAADPSTYIGVFLIVMALTVAATALPARRAMRVDPIEALRSS